MVDLDVLSATYGATMPPAWLFLVLALPHIWYMYAPSVPLRPSAPLQLTQAAVLMRALARRWVLLHPSSTKRTAAWFRLDAVEWFASVALVMNVSQFAALLLFIATSGRFSLSGLAARWVENPLRVLAVPLFALGSVFKVAIFTTIGKKGVYYGAKFGHSIPWVHGFPFNVTGAQPPSPQRSLDDQIRLTPARAAHPQYLGSSLCIISAGVALHDAKFPGNDLLPLWWVVLYLLTGLAEEGLCHSVEPFAPLPKGADPLVDGSSRPVVSAEAVRLVLMAPFIFVRWALGLGCMAAYVLSCRCVSAVASPARAARAHERLTRLVARALLMLLGFHIQVDGAAHAVAHPEMPVVCNCLSYVDALLLLAAFGPLQPCQPLPVRGVPLVAALLRCAGVQAHKPLSFPEGRRSAGGCLLPFAAACWPPGCRAVQPATVCYAAANSFNAAWVAPHATPAHLFQLTAAWMKTARLRILPAVVQPTAAGCSDATAKALSAALAWPLVGAAGLPLARGRPTSPTGQRPAKALSPSPQPGSARRARGKAHADAQPDRALSPAMLSPRRRAKAA